VHLEKGFQKAITKQEMPSKREILAERKAFN